MGGASWGATVTSGTRDTVSLVRPLFPVAEKQGQILDSEVHSNDAGTLARAGQELSFD